MISSIKQFLIKNKRIIYYFVFFLFIFFVFWDISFAEEKVMLVKTKKDWEEVANMINTTLLWLSAVVWIFTYFITLFLEPEWINGTMFWLDLYFKDIWILVSNVVYFIFAFLLIWIAFMNIIWKWQDKYELKQALPKFIIWVLMVPFSWFIVQFILSVSAVLTVSALSLPYDTFDQIWTEINKIKIPTKCDINMKSSWTSSNWKNLFTCDENESKQASLWESMKSSAFGIIAIYTYGILKLDEVTKVFAKDIEKWKIKNIWDLIIHIVFNVLFVLIYAILIIALWLVLVVRWIYLWLFTMLSPIFWLMYFFDKNDGWGEWFLSKFSFKQLISLALVPVYTILALGFGFLFMFIIINWMWDNANYSAGVEFSKVKLDEKWITIKNIDWQDKDFRLNVTWVDGGGSGKTLSNLFKSWLWSVWNLLMKIFWVVVLWVAVMAALNSSDITAVIVKPLYDFWNQVWQLVAKSPQYMPLFWGQSMQSMSRVSGSLESHYQTKASKKASEFLKDTPFGPQSNVVSELQSITSESRAWKIASPENRIKALRKTLSLADGNTKKLHTDSQFQNTLFELFSRIIKKDEMDKIVKSPSDIDSLSKLTKLASKVDWTSKYENLFDWTLWSGDETKFKKFVESLSTKKSKTDTAEKNNNTVIVNKSPDWKTYNINMWDDKIFVNKDWKIIEDDWVKTETQITNIANNVKTEFKDNIEQIEEKKLKEYLKDTFKVTDPDNVKDIIKESKE